MHLLIRDQIPAKAKAYVTLVIFVGLPIFIYCFYYSFTGSDLRWLYVAVLAVIGSSFPVNVPSTKQRSQSLSISVSDVFVFTGILLFGPEVAATISVIDGVLINFRTKIKRLYKQLFNIAELVIVSFVVGQIFYQLQGKPAPLDPAQLDSIARLLINLGLCALLYFLLNSGAVAVAIALVTNQPVGSLWKQNFLWASVTNFAGASAAAVIFLYFCLLYTSPSPRD